MFLKIYVRIIEAPSALVTCYNYSQWCFRCMCSTCICSDHTHHAHTHTHTHTHIHTHTHLSDEAAAMTMGTNNAGWMQAVQECHGGLAVGMICLLQNRDQSVGITATKHAIQGM